MLTQVYIDIVYDVSCTTTYYLNVKGADGLPYENGIPLRVLNCINNENSMMLDYLIYQQRLNDTPSLCGALPYRRWNWAMYK